MDSAPIPSGGLPPAPADRRLKARAGMASAAVAIAAAASSALKPVSPEEEAYRAQLPTTMFPNGGGRCFPVHCNGKPGLLCLPRDQALAIQVGRCVCSTPCQVGL
jgi:hypothetical protein